MYKTIYINTISTCDIEKYILGWLHQSDDVNLSLGVGGWLVDTAQGGGHCLVEWYDVGGAEGTVAHTVLVVLVLTAAPHPGQETQEDVVGHQEEHDHPLDQSHHEQLHW